MDEIDKISEDLFEQYDDCVNLLTRKVLRVQALLVRPRKTSSERTDERLIMLNAVRSRLALLRQRQCPQVSGLAPVSLPSWYLVSEHEADVQSPWRLGSAIERLGRSLAAPVQ